MVFAGICVADPVEVSVSLPLSLDVPLPYQVVRGEQLKLKGSVYNQLERIQVPTRGRISRKLESSITVAPHFSVSPNSTA